LVAFAAPPATLAGSASYVELRGDFSNGSQVLQLAVSRAGSAGGVGLAVYRAQ
jgi:hypothetical protein